MRIINGKYGGRIFNINVSSPTRPTSNFAKEALFNILKNRFEFSTICALDLFAGIGSVGFEFSSLDVVEITMIDENKTAVETLKKIAQTLQAKNVRIEKLEVFKFLEKNTHQYNFIFADPPYDFKYNEQLMNTIFEKNILLPDGFFVLEHYKKNDFQKMPFFKEVRHYGDCSFSFFKP